MDNIKELTDLQQSIGYLPGFLSPVAILGLAGESGEVLAELIPSGDLSGLTGDNLFIVHNHYVQARERMDWFVSNAKQVDNLKKSIRGNALSAQRLSFIPQNDDAFDEELADVLYYLNALAIGRGLTLNDLARMSHAKVVRKRANVGPEFTGKAE